MTLEKLGKEIKRAAIAMGLYEGYKAKINFFNIKYYFNYECIFSKGLTFDYFLT